MTEAAGSRLVGLSMTLAVRLLRSSCLVFIAALCIGVASSSGCTPVQTPVQMDEEGVAVVQKALSPNGKLVAVVYEISGGPSGMDYNIVVIRDSAEATNFLGQHRPVVNFAGICPVELSWSGDSKLVVRKTELDVAAIGVEDWKQRGMTVEVVLQRPPPRPE